MILDIRFEENFGETKMAPRRISRAAQIAVREISNQQEGDTPHSMGGTPQEEEVVNPVEIAPTARQEPNMAQLMQTIVEVI